MALSWRAPVTGIALATILALPGMTQAQDNAVELSPATMKRVGQVDERYQSYNVEMLEVTGGRFWKPYKDIKPQGEHGGQSAADTQAGDTPGGMSPDLYQYRPPIDLTNVRLRAMAPLSARLTSASAAPGPIRPTSPTPTRRRRTRHQAMAVCFPRQQWLGVIDFSRAVNAQS